MKKTKDKRKQDRKNRLITAKKARRAKRKLFSRSDSEEESKFKIISPLLQFCWDHLSGSTSIIKQVSGYKIKIPKDFSFLDNPAEAIDTICSLLEAGFRPKYNQLFIDHSRCEKIDMAASLIFDLICMEFFDEWPRHPTTERRFFAGQHPRLDRVRKMIRANGLTKHLRVPLQQMRPQDSLDILCFELFQGQRSENQLTSTDQDRAAQKVVDYFNACLETKNFQLNLEGKQQLILMVGEVIDNAEEHSGNSTWYIIGYLDQSEEVGECSLAIVNFGRTIYQSLNDESVSEEIKGKLDRLSSLHESRGLFSSADKWDKQELWTLYSLQDGVSRKRDHTEDGKDRGVGTIKMIEFFKTFGDTTDHQKKPKMTLISGRSRIVFDEKYSLAKKNLEGEERSVIAFNAENSLEEKPDKNNVHFIKGFFPGTILSMRFYIDKHFLHSLDDEVKNGS